MSLGDGVTDQCLIYIRRYHRGRSPGSKRTTLRNTAMLMTFAI